MDEEQNKFKVYFELVTDKFKTKMHEVENRLRGIEDDKRINLTIDTKKLDDNSKAALAKFDTYAKRFSKVNLFSEMLGNGRKGYDYARLFNDVRDKAITALSGISEQLPELELNVKVSDTNSKRLVADYEARLQRIKNLQQKITRYTNNIAELKASNVMALDPKSLTIKGSNDEAIDNTNTLLKQTKQEIKDIEQTLPPLLEKIDKTELIKDTDIKKLNTAKTEYEAILGDLNNNILFKQATSKTLQPMNAQAKQIQQRWYGINSEVRKNNFLVRLGRSIISRMRFSIVNLLNPINIARKSWQHFMEYNPKIKNTFDMIGQNLMRIIEPLMQRVVNWMLKLVQYANIFTKKWFGVDLLDKTTVSSNELKKNLDAATASFDELHSINENKDTLNNTEMPQLSLEEANNANKLADTLQPIGKTIGDVLSWAIKNPLLAGGLYLGAKILGPSILKGAGSLISKGFGALFGKNAALGSSVQASGSVLGNIFGKALYTGAGGKIVTLGKALGGLALAAGGTTLAITNAVEAGSNWQDLSTGTKVAKAALVGLGSAAAGVGAVMLGASGPAGWAIAGGVALGSLAIGMFQVQDGIDGVAKEQEKLRVAQENAKIANDNYLTSLNNLAITTSNLEQIERETGLSGEMLAQQVKNGELSIDDMTEAQIRCYNAYVQNEEMIKRTKKSLEDKIATDKQEVLSALKAAGANAIETKSYDELRTKVIKAWKDGSISAEEAGNILSRVMANADRETQATFGNSIPKEIKACYEPKQYESGWRKFADSFKSLMGSIGDWFHKKWEGIKSWWNGLWNKNKVPEPSVPSGPNGEKWTGASYAVGTNYVPNDQLAMIHKGEAIIPAKYNNPSTFGLGNDALNAAITNMNATLNALMQQGINVTGEFMQRGSDLYATVEKAKYQKGTSVISNETYAR